MTPKAVARAKLMLAQLVQTKASYAEVARSHGVARSSVQRSLRALVERVSEAGELPVHDPVFMMSIAGIRAHGQAVLDAAGKLKECSPYERQASITPRELQEAAARLRARSDNGNRDVALLYLVFSTGARPLEVARLRVRDYLAADGTSRRVSAMPDTTGGSSAGRPVYFTASRLQEAIDAYLRERALRGLGAGKKSRYRGLNPDSPLFLTGSGGSFELKGRYESDRYIHCPGLVALFRVIFKKAGLKGVTTRTARRQVARSLAAFGASEDQLKEVLGVATARSVRNLTRPVERPTESLMQELV